MFLLCFSTASRADAGGETLLYRDLQRQSCETEHSKKIAFGVSQLHYLFFNSGFNSAQCYVLSDRRKICKRLQMVVSYMSLE